MDYLLAGFLIAAGWGLAAYLYLERVQFTPEQKAMLREAEADKMVYDSYVRQGREARYWWAKKVTAEHMEKKYLKKD